MDSIAVVDIDRRDITVVDTILRDSIVVDIDRRTTAVVDTIQRDSIVVDTIVAAFAA